MGHQGEWVSRHAGAGGVAGRGVGVQIVQRVGCSIWTSDPDLLRDKLADATGYPLPPPRPAASQHPPCAISVPLTPVNHGQQRCTVTRPDHRSRPLTAQWAQPSKLAMRVRFPSPAPVHPPAATAAEPAATSQTTSLDTRDQLPPGTHSRWTPSGIPRHTVRPGLTREGLTLRAQPDSNADGSGWRWCGWHWADPAVGRGLCHRRPADRVVQGQGGW